MFSDLILNLYSIVEENRILSIWYNYGRRLNLAKLSLMNNNFFNELIISCCRNKNFGLLESHKLNLKYL